MKKLFQALPFVPLGYPSEVYWKCDKLKKMDVSHNRLRGLPECFSDLKRLSTLNASHNYLKELPQSCSHGCINLVSCYMYTHVFIWCGM